MVVSRELLSHLQGIVLEFCKSGLRWQTDGDGEEVAEEIEGRDELGIFLQGRHVSEDQGCFT